MDEFKNEESLLEQNLEGKRKKKSEHVDEAIGSIEPEEMKHVLACKSVFKCRLCPWILCINVESLAAHLKSKRHARSKILFAEGRLKLMLNDDGEIEEETETHAERHARILALTQKSITKKKNKGRQRQRKRAKKSQKRLAGEITKADDLVTYPPAKKKRKAKD